jgi:hypothetical protein
MMDFFIGKGPAEQQYGDLILRNVKQSFEAAQARAEEEKL